MNLAEFFSSNKQQSTNQNQVIQQNNQNENGSGNPEIDNFCQKFFANAGPDYKNTPVDFLRLCFKNKDMILNVLNSPVLRQFEVFANNAVSKGLVSKDTVKSFEKALSLFK